jgi:hypothetical protein
MHAKNLAMPLSSSTEADFSVELKAIADKSLDAEKIDDFLMSCAVNNRWSLLKSALRYPHVRARLSHRIWDIQEQAVGSNTVEALCAALPIRLDADTAREALKYPIGVKSWALTNGMLQLGAQILDEQFAHACNVYAFNPDPFFRQLIEWAVRKQMVSWQHTLGFNNYDDWEELVARADRDRNPALYLVASCIMNAKQKKTILKHSTTSDRVLLIVKNMDLPSHWQEAIPPNFRSEVLSCQLGV